MFEQPLYWHQLKILMLSRAPAWSSLEREGSDGAEKHDTSSVDRGVLGHTLVCPRERALSSAVILQAFITTKSTAMYTGTWRILKRPPP